MVKFYTDHYFHIGSAHYSSGKPCQDYALSGSNETLACAIVSDGCSTGRHTDVGSRILTFSTLQAIRDHARASGGSLETAVISITSRQQQIMGTTRFTLGLIPEDMQATCVYAYLTKEGGVVHVQGDGVFALKYLDGCIEIHRFDWAKNAPFYPSYGDVDGEKYILNLHEGKKETATLLHVSLKIAFDGKIENENESIISFDKGRNGFVYHISTEQINLLEYVVVFTDGVSQVGNLPSGGDTIPNHISVVNFLSFKSFAGEFAKRRMMRGIKDLEKIGKGPVDDISYAVIRIEKTEEGEKSSG